MKPNIKNFILFAALIVIATYTNSFAITGSEALAKFRGRMASIGKLTGIISWTVNSGQTFTGSFKYLNPGKIYVKFSNQGGKTLVSNGKKLWVYSPSNNICGVQDLTRGGSGGIAGMVSGYLAIVTSQSSSGYTLKLKSNNKRYTEITLYLTSSFFLKKAIFKTKDGKAFSVSISNVNTSVSVMNSLFNFRVPANAQVVKNPLNIR